MRSRRLVPGGALLLAALPLPAQPGGPLPAAPPALPGRQLVERRRQPAPVDPRSAGASSSSSGWTGAHPPRLRRRRGSDLRPRSTAWSTSSVPGSQPLVPVTFVEYGDESDDGAPGRPPGYPIPEAAKTRAALDRGRAIPATPTPDGDRHLLLVDRDRRILYELYHTRWNAGRGRWEAGSGAVFPLDPNRRRPEGWTSADAAGLAILPGLVRYDEVFGPGPDPPRLPLHGAPHQRPRLPGLAHAPATRPTRCRWARACGSRRARTSPATRPSPQDLPGDEDLRPDRRRQRHGHVHHRHLRHALGQRRAQPGLRLAHARATSR